MALENDLPTADTPFPSEQPIHRNGANGGHGTNGTNGLSVDYEEHPSVSLSGLTRARDNLFPNGKKTRPLGESHEYSANMYAEITKPNENEEYGGIDRYAQDHNFVDVHEATKRLHYASVELIQHGTIADPATVNAGDNPGLLVVGPGEGRLLEMYVLIAEALKLSHITLVELIPDLLDRGQKRAKDIFGTEEWKKPCGIPINWIEGDFVTTNIDTERHAFAITWWFVENEILHSGSFGDIRRYRDKFHCQINQQLITDGVYISDVIHPNKGLYKVGTDRTQTLLKDKKILQPRTQTRHIDLLLTSWEHEQEEYPYQLRACPTREQYNNEMRKAGFELDYPEEMSMPHHSIVGLEDAIRPLKRAKGDLKSAINSMKGTRGSDVTTPESAGIHANNIPWRRISTFFKRKDTK